MLRVEHLAKYLGETDMTVTAAMQCVGWRSRSHATRLFRQYVGVAPGHYRRRRAPAAWAGGDSLPRDAEKIPCIRPHCHPMHVESATDGDHALAVGAGSSDSVYLALCQGCSSSSPRLRDDARLALAGTMWLIVDAQFRLIPRRTEPLEPLPGVRFESTRVHN